MIFCSISSQFAFHKLFSISVEYLRRYVISKAEEARDRGQELMATIECLALLFSFSLEVHRSELAIIQKKNKPIVSKPLKEN